MPRSSASISCPPAQPPKPLSHPSVRRRRKPFQQTRNYILPSDAFLGVLPLCGHKGHRLRDVVFGRGALRRTWYRSQVSDRLLSCGAKCKWIIDFDVLARVADVKHARRCLLSPFLRYMIVCPPRDDVDGDFLGLPL